MKNTLVGKPGKCVPRSNPVVKVVILLSGFFLSCPAGAFEAVLKEVEPLGAQRGKTFTLKLKGEGLTPGSEVITTIPGTFSRLAPPKDLDKSDSILPFLVQLPADAPVGVYPIRVRTAEGLSNILLFGVGDLPEIRARDPHDSFEQAQLITPPVTVDGRLTGPKKDYYRFTTKAGERLVFEVEARRLGSAIDPVIEVFDSKASEIAFNDDAPGLGVDSRVEVSFTKAGTYYVLVHDSKYSNQVNNHYRLKVGYYAYADGIFPLGWRRGEAVEVTFFGGNLPKPVTLRLNLPVPANREFTPIDLPWSKPIGSLPFQFRVGDLPELLELAATGSPAELRPLTVVNGRISKPGEVDRYRLRVSPGEQWLVQIEAASLGTSQLYASLSVEDPKGKQLATSDVGSAGPGRHGGLVGEGADPMLAFTVPNEAKQVILAVKDVRRLGGPSYGYRLLAQRESGDFSLKLLTPYVNVPANGTAAVAVVAVRHGYDGPIQLSIPGLPSDFVVAGGHVAAEILNYEGKREHNTIGYLTLTAKPGTNLRVLQLSVWGEGQTAEGPIRRRAEGPGLLFDVNEEPVLSITGDPLPQKPVSAGWLGMELPAAVRDPVPASFAIAARQIRLVQGLDCLIDWKLVKHDPGVKITEVGGLDLPTIKDLSLNNTDKTSDADSGKLRLTSTLDTPLVKFDVVPRAAVKFNGKEETVIGPAITAELVPGFSLALASERVELKTGGKVELAGTVHREPAFPGIVTIKVGDPPDKVTCLPVEVQPDKTEFRVVCEASAGAAEGDFMVHLVPSAIVPGRKDNREFKIPFVAAHLIVRGEKGRETASNQRQ